MKILALLAAVAATGLSGGAFAQTCPGAGFNTTPFTAFAGKTVCVSNVSGGWEAQEEHRGSGNNGDLYDYKQGPASSTNTVDPTTKIGTWSVDTASGIITYMYDPSSTYSYKAYTSTSTIVNQIKFCPEGSSGTLTTATLKVGNGPCP